MKEELIELLEPPVRAMGYELVELEYSPAGGGSLLRLYIDGPGGITLDDCEQVSNHISGLLDVEDPIPGAYNLEVSSPGIDRPLRTLAHFQHFAGQVAKIQLDAPLNGRRRYKGQLQGVEGETVQIEVDGELHELPFGRISKARLVPDI